MSDSFATPALRTVAHQACLSMGFPRQEYWSGLPFPSPGDLPYPGIEPTSPALAGIFFTTLPPGKPYYAKCIMWNARLEEAQAGIKIARRNINNLRYADATALMGESEKELKGFLMRMKQESGKADLKFIIQKLRSWHPVPSLHGELKVKKWKQWQSLFSWAPKSLQTMTAAMNLKDTCSLEGRLWQT